MSATATTPDSFTLSCIRPYSQSKYPALGLALLFASSSIAPAFLPSLRPVPTLGTRPHFPPFLHRVGFAAAFGTASYVLAAGDVRNGSGIATAWSLTYLFFHLRNALRPPRHPVGLVLASSVTGCAALYGTEYFYFQD